jgi:hypothetical protein
MCQNDVVIGGGPLQNCWIICTNQSHVLNSS